MKIFKDEKKQEYEDEITDEEIIFVDTYDDLAKNVHANAVKKGFWEDGLEEKSMGDIVSNIHEEVSELWAAHRSGNNPQSKKIPEFSLIEEEAADLILRVMDLGKGKGLDVGSAMIAKNRYNKTRPYKHGKIC